MLLGSIRSAPGHTLVVMKLSYRLAPSHDVVCVELTLQALHAVVCDKVAKMTQMRHDNLANALRLVVSACSCHCQLAAEPRYRALAGRKGMGDISAGGTPWRCCRGSSCGSGCRGCACVREVVHYSSCQDSWVDCGKG